MARSAVSTPEIDRILATSKRLTGDLQLLRHEVRDSAQRASEEGLRRAKTRVLLLMDNAHAMNEDLYALWESMTEGLSPKRQRSARLVREIEDGTFKLTAGGAR